MEDNKNFETAPQTDEAVQPQQQAEEIIQAEGKTLDKKKVGIIAGIAAAVVVIIIALALILGGGKTGVGGDNGGGDGNGEVGGNGSAGVDDGKGDKDDDKDEDDKDDDKDEDDKDEDNKDEDNKDEDEDPTRNEFIGSLDGISETFGGVASEENYDTASDAASAFVGNEICGEKSPVVLSSERRGELNANQIAQLNIADSVPAGFSSVECYEVSYTFVTVQSASRSGASSNTEKVTVYVIKYDNYWKYFAPLPETGDTINKSYYDSVFNNEKYQNCTLEQTNIIIADSITDGERFDLSMTISNRIKFDANKMYIEYTMAVTELGESDSINMYFYLEENEYDELISYASLDGEEWMEVEFSDISSGLGCTSIEELTPFYGQYFDYTYFTKADYGFKLSNDRANDYFADAIAGALDGLVDQIGDDMELDVYAEYYITDGTLSGMRSEANVEITVIDGGSTTQIWETVKYSAKCTDYGTTVVEKPNLG